MLAIHRELAIHHELQLAQTITLPKKDEQRNEEIVLHTGIRNRYTVGHPTAKIHRSALEFTMHRNASESTMHQKNANCYIGGRCLHNIDF